MNDLYQTTTLPKSMSFQKQFFTSSLPLNLLCSIQIHSPTISDDLCLSFCEILVLWVRGTGEYCMYVEERRGQKKFTLPQQIWHVFCIKHPALLIIMLNKNSYILLWSVRDFIKKATFRWICVQLNFQTFYSKFDLVIREI